MKLLVRVLAGLAVFAAAIYAGIRIFVGGINVPVGLNAAAPHQLASQLQVPPGFHLDIYADVQSARVMRLTSTGDLLVSVPGNDKIVLLPADRNGDGRSDGQRVLLDKKMVADLKDPNGIDIYRDAEGRDWLYVAENESIGRIRFDQDRGSVMGSYERIISNLPGGGNHWKKTLRFGPDGLLYVAMGSSCNVCIEEDKRRAAISRYQPDGSGGEIFASGLRNSAGFDWSPIDTALYATDNGRDLLGDDFPPCEFNKIEQGKFYGWPFANGNRIPDPDHGAGHADDIASSIPPIHGFRAHNAPLGMTFLRYQPSEAYRHVALVALHGSWNRSKKDGYKVVSLHQQSGGAVEERDFVTGFLTNDNVIGRPADVIEAANGTIYVSDDYAGKIYRITYTN